MAGALAYTHFAEFGKVFSKKNNKICKIFDAAKTRGTGSITPFGVGQKVNIIVTLVEIMVTFCELQNVIRV